MRIFKIYLVIIQIFFFSKAHASEIKYGNPVQIPNFSLKDFKGKEYFLDGLAGNILILHFWATWCNACYQEMKEIDFFQKKIRDKPIIVIPISEDFKNSEDVEKYYQENGLYNLLGFTDRGNKIFRDLNITSLPTTIIINSSGYEVGRADGIVDWNNKDLIKNLLAHASQKPVVNADYLSLMNSQFSNRLKNAEAKKIDPEELKVEEVVPKEAVTNVAPVELENGKELPDEIKVTNSRSEEFSLKIRRPVNNNQIKQGKDAK